jgi:hypothetical protein
METVEHFNIAGFNLYISHSVLVNPFSSIRGFSEFIAKHNTSPSNITLFEKEEHNINVKLNANFSNEEIELISKAKLLYKFESENIKSSFFINDIAYGKNSLKHSQTETVCFKNGKISNWPEHIFVMEEADKEPFILFCTGDNYNCNWEQNRNPSILRFALWMAYGMSTSKFLSIPIHSSAIAYNEKIYLFLGESGTGKSTHTSLWRRYIPGASLLNDDSPIVTSYGDKMYVSGSPWSGKTPCYVNQTYQLGAVIRLSQAPYNRATKLDGISSMAALLPSTPPAFQMDPKLQKSIYSFIDKIIRTTPVYSLECLPDANAVNEIIREMKIM